MRQYIVIGLGYVGINLFNSLQKKYSNVIGIDTNSNKISQLKKGYDPSQEIKNFKLINGNICSNSLEKTTKLYLETIFFICVPTPLKSLKPDLSNFENALKQISVLKLKKPFIIVNESSVYPGQTESISEKIFKCKNYKRNFNYFLSFSPERINPGDKKHNFNNINKIVSSDNPKTLKLVSNIYKKITKGNIIISNSIFEAEASKLIENTQRDVNIALMNELETIFQYSNGDFQNILALANTKWNFCDFKPGFVGGHCIAIDPYYLMEYAKKNNKKYTIIKKSRDINKNKIDELLSIILKFQKKNKKKKYNILILGLTYKPNVPDIRESQAIRLINKLKKDSNTKIYYYDKFITNYADLKSIKINDRTKFDIIIKMTIHDNMEKDLPKIRKKLNKNSLEI